jgi:methylenetetrahydrofolate dehydrogenase (NADP+)/methenyltetrahydrofolate cyclohydrolase
MTAELIDGKAIAASVRADVATAAAEVSEILGRSPTLATVLVGEDPASEVYIRNKHAACAEVGIESVHHSLSADIDEGELVALVESMSVDPEIDGILVQLPLPSGLDEDRVIGAISPDKDVDGLTTSNAGLLATGRSGLVPCTPAGVIEMLDRIGFELEGADAVVIGRSQLVGRPLVSLLLQRNATVTICHSRTRDLAATCRRADLVIAAVGVPGLVGPDCIKPGATVIDVGINRTDDGLVGDVEFEPVAEVAGAITPVPGGVGPMTIAMLLANTVSASRPRD